MAWKKKRKKEHLKCNLDIYLVYRYKLVVELWNTGHYYLCIVLKCTHHSQLFKKSISTFSSHYYLEEVCSKLLPVFTTLAFCPFFIFFFHLSKKQSSLFQMYVWERRKNSLLSHPGWWDLWVFKVFLKRILWPSFILIFFIWHLIFLTSPLPFLLCMYIAGTQRPNYLQTMH